jgi:hypothetical protein
MKVVLRGGVKIVNGRSRGMERRREGKEKQKIMSERNSTMSKQPSQRLLSLRQSDRHQSEQWLFSGSIGRNRLYQIMYLAGLCGGKDEETRRKSGKKERERAKRNINFRR